MDYGNCFIFMLLNHVKFETSVHSQEETMSTTINLDLCQKCPSQHQL